MTGKIAKEIDAMVDRFDLGHAIRHGIIVGFVVFFFTCSMSLVVMAFRPGEAIRPKDVYSYLEEKLGDVRPADVLAQVQVLEKSVEELRDEVAELKVKQELIKNGD